MKPIILLTFIGFLFSIYHATAATGDEIVMASGDWCPYVCDPEFHAGRHGYLPDIAKIVFERAGHSFKMEYMPFARATRQAREGKYNGIPGVYKGDVPDFIFPSKSQGIGISTFYVLKNSSWKFENYDSLKDLKQLGLIRDYYYGEGISKFVRLFPAKVNMLYGHDCQRRALQQLRIGRISAWLEDNHVAQYNIRRTGLTGEIVASGHLDESLQVYIAFSPRFNESREYARLIVEGVEKLRKTGELQKILAAYGMDDWTSGDSNN